MTWFLVSVTFVFSVAAVLCLTEDAIRTVLACREALEIAPELEDIEAGYLPLSTVMTHVGMIGTGVF